MPERTSAPKALILDLNGVLLVGQPVLSKRVERDFGVPVAEFLPELSRTMDALRKPGAAPAWTFWQPLLQRWNIPLDETGWWDYWFTSELPVPEAIDAVRAVRDAGIRTFILSNNFRERTNFYSGYPWLPEVVEKSYFSWQTGFVKPNPEAFTNLLETEHLEAADCLYLDDQEKNIVTARSLGFTAEVYTGPEQIRALLK